jgi:uncharacterized surface anchored protein
MNPNNLNNFTIQKEKEKQIPVATTKKIPVNNKIKQRSCYFERNARAVLECHSTYKSTGSLRLSKTGQASQVHTRQSNCIHLREIECHDKTNFSSIFTRNLSLLQRERNSPQQNLKAGGNSCKKDPRKQRENEDEAGIKKKKPELVTPVSQFAVSGMPREKLPATT